MLCESGIIGTRAKMAIVSPTVVLCCWWWLLLMVCQITLGIGSIRTTASSSSMESSSAIVPGHHDGRVIVAANATNPRNEVWMSSFTSSTRTIFETIPSSSKLSSSSTSSSSLSSLTSTTTSVFAAGTQYIGLNLLDNGAAAIPPDSTGAVSRTTLLAATSWLVEVRTKATGQVTYQNSFRTFFASLSPYTGSLLYDPRVIYDEYEDRLCLIVAERRGATGPGLYSDSVRRRRRDLRKDRPDILVRIEEEEDDEEQQQPPHDRPSQSYHSRRTRTSSASASKKKNTTRKHTKSPTPLSSTPNSNTNNNATADQVSRLLLAISKDGSPTGPQDFYFQAITSLEYNPVQNSNYWADFPGFEAGPDALYICATVYTFNNAAASNRLWIVHKTPLYQGGTIVYTRHSPYTNGIIPTCTPSYVYGGQILTSNNNINNNNNKNLIGTYLVSYEGSYSQGKLIVIIVAVVDPLGTPQFPQTLVPIGNTVDATYLALLDAPQLGGTNTNALIATNDRRVLDACWRNNRLWMTFEVMPPQGPNVNQTTAYWVKINTLTMTVDDQGEIGGEDIAPNTFTFFPSVAVNKAGVAAFGFSASGLSIHPGAYMVGRAPSDPKGAVTQSLEVKVGMDFYNRSSNRWGDFSGAAVDPSDDSFWIYNEYAAKRTTTALGQTGVWSTAWRNFQSLATPSPTMAPTRPPPTLQPTFKPTPQPTLEPTPAPTLAPSSAPTLAPSSAPVLSPTLEPSRSLTLLPTPRPPTQKPTRRRRITKKPTTHSPSKLPTELPTAQAPNSTPTIAPSQLSTVRPTAKRRRRPRSKPPTAIPTLRPTISLAPTRFPILLTTAPSNRPTTAPTHVVTTAPSNRPTAPPTLVVTTAPSNRQTAPPTASPSMSPTQAVPSSSPSTHAPTVAQPTFKPTLAKRKPTVK